MRVEIRHPSQLTDDAWTAWRAIRTADPRLDSPYFSDAFVRIAGSVRPDARVVVVLSDSGQHEGFLPVQVSGMGLARPLGAPFSDCHGPVMPEDLLPHLPKILGRAGLSGYAFTGLAAPPRGLTSAIRGTTQASIADLTPGFETYLESRRSEYPKHFKKARRLGRQSAREAGELSMAFHSGDHAIMRQLIQWKRDQFARTGLHDVLAAEWVQDMLYKCLDAQTDDFSGVLSTLHLGDQLAAAEFGIRSGGVLHGWISGYNPEFASFSPGILLQERLLESACSAGITRADLGVGADHYKKYYASHSVELSEGVVAADGAAGLVRRALEGAWMFAEASPIGPVGRLASSARRRLDNILAVETTLGGRARGVARAFNRNPS